MQNLPILRYLTPAGLALIWWGYFGPWISHQAASLRLSGYMLSEWVSILPEVRTGAAPFTKPHFILPLLLVMTLTATIVSRDGTKQLSRWRWGVIVAMLIFSVYLLLVDPSIIFLRSDATMQLVVWWFGGAWLAIGLILLFNWDGSSKNWNLLLQIGIAAGLMWLNWWLITNVMPWIIGLFNMTPPIGNGWIMSQVGAGLLVINAFIQRIQIRREMNAAAK